MQAFCDYFKRHTDWLDGDKSHLEGSIKHTEQEIPTHPIISVLDH